MAKLEQVIKDLKAIQSEGRAVDVLFSKQPTPADDAGDAERISALDAMLKRIRGEA